MTSIRRLRWARDTVISSEGPVFEPLSRCARDAATRLAGVEDASLRDADRCAIGPRDRSLAAARSGPVVRGGRDPRYAPAQGAQQVPLDPLAAVRRRQVAAGEAQRLRRR